MEKVMKSTDQLVEEIMKIHKSFPARPEIEEVEAAKTLIQSVDKEKEARLESVSTKTKSVCVPDELFKVLQEMQMNLIKFQTQEQKREALKLLDLENAHSACDELIQRASDRLSTYFGSPKTSGSAYCPNGSASTSSSTSSSATSHVKNSFSAVAEPANAPPSSSLFSAPKKRLKSPELVSRDDSYVTEAKSSFHNDAISSTAIGHNGEKLSLISLAGLIEVSAKRRTRELDLRNKLMDRVEWLPDSIGKLSLSLITLDLSENQIVVLPDTIGDLVSLTKLDLHCNRLAQLPESIGNLINIISLDLSGNQLSSLPLTFGSLVCLEELDLSSNSLFILPDSIGSFTRLKKLNVETNNIEEIPHTIGRCSCLKELRVDYNRLKALPEAIGKLESLQILSVRYNNITQLPTTMSSLTNLKELDVSFNELELVPESLCFATKLCKLNMGNNFSDLKTLPRAIGNLEMLQELDISNNQIRVLPESFRLLTNLSVLRVEENPLQVPPRHIAEKGAQAVVRYMAELVEKKDTKIQLVKKKAGWPQMHWFTRAKDSSRSSSGASRR